MARIIKSEFEFLPCHQSQTLLPCALHWPGRIGGVTTVVVGIRRSLPTVRVHELQDEVHILLVRLDNQTENSNSASSNNLKVVRQWAQQNGELQNRITALTAELRKKPKAAAKKSRRKS